MVRAGRFDTRYRQWGTSGPPVVLVPGALETANTFATLGPVLAASHRVFAIDLTGTGYRAPSQPVLRAGTSVVLDFGLWAAMSGRRCAGWPARPGLPAR